MSNQIKKKEKISQIFKILDKNNDGSIDVQELKTAYIKFYGKQSPQGTSTVEELAYILFKIDKNKSGKIDLSEFTAAVYDRKKLFIKKYLEQAFDYFDFDCSGYIEKINQREFYKDVIKNNFSKSQIKQIQMLMKKFQNNNFWHIQ